MNVHLFDSSAIINLCGKKNINPLLGGSTLDLAFYEIGNAIWKQVFSFKIYTMKEGEIVLGAITDVLQRMKIIDEMTPIEILRLAVKTSLTFYDAAFLNATITNNLTLVTDDKRFSKISKKFVTTTSSNIFK